MGGVITIMNNYLLNDDLRSNLKIADRISYEVSSNEIKCIFRRDNRTCNLSYLCEENNEVKELILPPKKEYLKAIQRRIEEKELQEFFQVQETCHKMKAMDVLKICFASAMLIYGMDAIANSDSIIKMLASTSFCLFCNYLAWQNIIDFNSRIKLMKFMKERNEATKLRDKLDKLILKNKDNKEKVQSLEEQRKDVLCRIKKKM